MDIEERGEESGGGPSGTPIEDITLTLTHSATRGDSKLRKVAFGEDGTLEVRTTVSDAWRQVEERREIQDPLWEIMVGPVSTCQEYVDKILPRANYIDPSGAFAEELTRARYTGDDVLTRILVVHAIMIEDLSLDDVGTRPIVIEDGVVIATNGICAQGFAALRTFIMDKKNAHNFLSGVGKYIGDLHSSVYLARMYFEYMNNRRPFDEPIHGATRRSTL